jgi:hypothetical protein
LESDAPFHWLSVDSLRNAIQLQYIRPSGDPEMPCNFYGRANHAHALRTAPKRDGITLGKLDDVWNVSAIGGQPRKTV